MAITKVTRTLLSTGIVDNSNATAITIDSNENVGIGTTSPSELLHVHEASTSVARMRLSNTEGYLEIGTNNQVMNLDSQTHTFRNEAGSTEYMRIDSSGNLLVGVTSTTLAGDSITLPNSGIIGFHDAGGSARNVLQFVSGTIKYGAAGAGIDTQTFHTSNTERMRINASGNISLACTSDYKTLTVGDTDAEAWITSGGSNTHLTLSANGTSGAVILRTGGTNGDPSATTERMRIDQSGNVGIGTSSPSQLLHLKSTGDAVIRIQADSDNANEDDNAYILFEQDGGAVHAYLGFDTDTNEFTVANQHNGSDLTFKTADTERMRIDADGIMLLGTTTRGIGTLGDVNAFGVAGNSNSVFPMVVFAEQDPTVEANSCILELSYSGDTSFSNSYYALFSDSGGTQGSISGTGGGTVAYNTSSDERIKENIVDTSSQLDKIKQVQVKDFNYIGKDVTTTGMIAQELNEIIPEVVIEGAEDATKHPWGIDYGKLTPYLIKAIQEQQTIIDDLKTRIETLENV